MKSLKSLFATRPLPVAIANDPKYQLLLQGHDDTIQRYVGASSLVALVVAAYISTFNFIIDEPFFVEAQAPELSANISLDLPPKEKKKVETKKTEKPSQAKHTGGKGKPSKGDPKAIRGQTVLDILTAKSNKPGLTPYDLFDKKMFRDIAKTMANAPRLVTSGTTIMGERRGAVHGTIDGSFFDGTETGLGDALGNLLGNGPTTISTRTKGSIKAPNIKDIDMPSNDGGRSVSDIMSVVRARTPGLRHIYTKHLKTEPGLEGKVTLRFTISPSGDIIAMLVTSTTTNSSSFDKEVAAAVSTWKFRAIKAGNTTVTIPFTFTE